MKIPTLIVVLLLSFACRAQIVVQQFDGDIGAGTSANSDHPNPSIDSNGIYRVEVTWQNINIYTVAGALQSSTNFQTFVANAGGASCTGHCQEPRVIFEQGVSRWMITVGTAGDTLIVSSGSDPTTSTWKSTALTANTGDMTLQVAYGKSNGWLIFTEFVPCGGNAMTEIAMPAADAAWTGAGTISLAHEVISNCATNSAAPCTDLSNASPTAPLYAITRVGDAQTQTNASWILALDTFTPTSSTTGTWSNPASPTQISTGYLYNTPLDPNQPGSPGGVRGSESRRHWGCMTTNGTDLQAVAGSGPCASSCGAQPVGTQQISLWFDISIPGLTLAQKAIMTDANLGYLFPAMAVDAADNTVIVVAGCSTTQFCSLYSFLHLQSDAANTLRGPYLLTAGTQNLQVCNTTPHPGYGDWASAKQDAGDPTIIDAVNEYVNSATPCAWATRILKLQVNPPIVPAATFLSRLRWELQP